MTEREVAQALDDKNVGTVLIAITEVTRQKYAALLPKVLAFLRSDNEVFRAEVIDSYFTFMSEEARAQVPVMLTMLESDESSMVRGACARAIGIWTTFVQLDAKTKKDLSQTVVRRLREEENDTTRHELYGSFCKLVGVKAGDTPWALTVDAIDWQFVDGALASL